MFLRRFPLNRFGVWGIGAFTVAMILSVPIVSILFVAAQLSGDVWDHLIDTALPNTSILRLFGWWGWLLSLLLGLLLLGGLPCVNFRD